MSRLQLVQNAAARLITGVKQAARAHHASPMSVALAIIRPNEWNSSYPPLSTIRWPALHLCT